MKNDVKNHEESPTAKHTNRRNFLKISGITVAGTGLLLMGCKDDDNDTPIVYPTANNYPGVRNGTFDLGGGDFGVLTFAYALEQLEAEFYTRVVTNVGFAATFILPSEQQLLRDIYNHEVIHREFFRAALSGSLPDPATQLLPDLSFDFSSVNFSDRATVLSIARQLEDTGVGAYNGAGQYLENPDYLTLAGKIVSVEARHASAIRSLLNPDASDVQANFAGNNVVDPVTGLDKATLPSQVVAAVSSLGFITTPFTAQYLP